MKKKHILPCLLAVLLPGLALAAPGNGKAHKKIDTNGDGVISKSEAQDASAKRLVEGFADIDADGNGELTREELHAHKKKRMAERRGKAKDADTDGNGAISSDEAAAAGMQRLVENFDKIDADGDGEVTRKEMQQLRHAKGGKGKKGKGSGAGQGRG